MDASPRPAAHPMKGLILPLFALLLGHVGSRGTTLWAEYRSLQQEWEKDELGRAVGYPGIIPFYSHAESPKDWIRNEGESTFLWAGWDRKAKRHNWFVLKKGEIAAEHLSHPMGRDAIRAIDKPKVESRSGEVWNAMPSRNRVAAGEFLGVPVAYPLDVLNKVVAVNDEIHRKPFLIVFTPFVGDSLAVDLFSPIVDGTKKLTMGTAGYLWRGKPLLYDRETQSLWVSLEQGLFAIAGPARGKVIDRISHLDAVEWGEWRSNHPDGRLVAGAIRAESNGGKP